ncbi:MAG: response regulator transcription factor, partial [Phycicoccus sp.]
MPDPANDPGTGPAIRVVIVDDQPLARSGLRSSIDHEPGLAVVAEAADGREGVERVASTAP